jgi:hypothetical protein
VCVAQVRRFGASKQALRRSAVAGLVVGARGDLDPVLGQHGANRRDPEPLAVGIDEVD